MPKNGGIIIDTLGMRELCLESANLSKAFADIGELASMCKFHDCACAGEPCCSVQKAVCDGTLPAERLFGHQKFKEEGKYEGFNSRQIENIKLNEMFSGGGGMKDARKLIKEKKRAK